MVRKQNERTILLQYRIIPLSLPIQSFHILALRPLSTRLGAFSFPETFSRKFFPKFFPILPRRLFSGFLVRKIMGVEGAGRFPNGGGGYPFLHAFYIANRHLFASGKFQSPPAFPAFIVAHFQPKQVENRSKSNIFLLVFVSPRENRRPKTAKTKIYFTFGAFVVLLSSSFVVAVVVSIGCRWSGSLWLQDLQERLALVLWSCVPSFCMLSRLVFGVLSLNMALFRVLRAFLGGFMGFVWVYVACVFCVACVAFVRVWS